MFLSLVFSLSLAGFPESQTPLKGSELKSVPGPVAPVYPDPAAAFGADRFQLHIRHSARRSQVPAVEVPAGTEIIEDAIQHVAGWKAYRTIVPPQSTLHVRLKSDHEAWFRVRTVNRWGHLEKGMLHNRIYTGNPEASYRNYTPEPQALYFIVDTTEVSSEGETYTLHFTQTTGTEPVKPVKK